MCEHVPLHVCTVPQSHSEIIISLVVTYTCWVPRTDCVPLMGALDYYCTALPSTAHVVYAIPSWPTTLPTDLYSAECLCVPLVMWCLVKWHLFLSHPVCHVYQPSFRVAVTASCPLVRRAKKRLSVNCSQKTKWARMWWTMWGSNQFTVSLSTVS